MRRRIDPIVRPPPAVFTAADAALSEDARLLRAWAHLSDAEIRALIAANGKRPPYGNGSPLWRPPCPIAMARALELRAHQTVPA